jgi:CRISPR-associated protein Csb2
MSNVLRFTVRFLDPEPAFHGQRDGGAPEWPPSPMRLFQAIVDAAADRWRGMQFNECVRPALELLQRLPSPEIIAPTHMVGMPFRLSVPNNDLDSPASVWIRGAEPEKPHRPVDLRTMKTVHRSRLRIGDGEKGNAIHYLYPLPVGGCPHLDILKSAARSITHLGWGIDMAAADADVITEIDSAKLPGHRWRVVPVGGVPLRVPKVGTLDDLIRKHAAFLGRLSQEGFKPISPLSCFDVVGYYSPTVAGLSTPNRPIAAFEIQRTIEDQEKEEYAGKTKFRPFHHVRRVATVAGMMRNAAAAAARQIGWVPQDVTGRIEGHGDGDGGQATSDDRFLFLPLPSITPVGVSGIRRVLVVGPMGFDLAPLRRQLNGQELVDEHSKQPAAMLSSISIKDRNVKAFLGPATTWNTVTPVILPGYDDPDRLRAKLKERNTAAEQKNLLARLDSRILALIWKAFHQAGWTADVLAGAEVEYRAVGWRRGLDLARNYDLPPLKYPRYHVRVRFPHPIAGPLVVGAGRYRGLGVFAADGSA